MTTLIFGGYAALFNRLDRGGDIIRPQAFASLSTAAQLPLHWEHDALRRIGTVEDVAVDRHGLRVIGRINGQTRAGRQAIALVKAGAVRGLSFGYRVRRARGHSPRELIAVDVAEISLVRHPMQASAGVLALRYCAA